MREPSKLTILGLAMLVILELYTSCSKEEEPSNEPYLAKIEVVEHSVNLGERTPKGELYERYLYNSDGLLTTKVTNYYNSFYRTRLYNTYTYRYDEANKLQIRYEETFASQRKFVYEYNELDSVSKIKQYYTDSGELISVLTNEYDHNGNKILSSEEYSFQTTITSFYYDNNTVTEVIESSKKENAKDTIIRTYDERHNLIKVEKPDDKIDTYEYDSNNRLIKCSLADNLLGSILTFYDYHYKEDDKIDYIRVTHSNSDIISDLVYNYEWK